jgi:5-methylcytosine-specific restriction protein A
VAVCCEATVIRGCERVPTVKPRIRMSSPRVQTVGTRIVAPERRSARDRGYSSAWDRTVASFKNAHPWCVGCRAVGITTPTAAVDHVVPHRGYMAKFWTRSNWQPACRWHHDSVKKRLESMFERGAIGADQLRLDSAIAVGLTREAGRG